VKDDVLCPLYGVQINGVSLQFGSNSFYPKFLNETRPRKPARRPARSEQNPAKKFSFPFRKRNPARANQEKRRKLFCWVASANEKVSQIEKSQILVLYS